MHGCSLLHPGHISCMIDPWLRSSCLCKAAAAHHLEIWSLPSLQKHIWKGSVGSHNDVMPALHYSFDAYIWRVCDRREKNIQWQEGQYFLVHSLFSFPLSLSWTGSCSTAAVLSEWPKSRACSSSAAVTCCILLYIAEIAWNCVNWCESPAPQHYIGGREQWLDYTSQYLDG